MSGGSRDKELRMGGRGEWSRERRSPEKSQPGVQGFFFPVLAHPLQMGAAVLELERRSYQANWPNVCEDGMPKYCCSITRKRG